jgi:hypothetical protein
MPTVTGGQRLHRFRCWYRELRGRNSLDVPSTVDAARNVNLCEERFQPYEDNVCAALGSADV